VRFSLEINDGSIAWLAFSPDSKLLAGASGNDFRVWDLAADKEAFDHTRRQAGTRHLRSLSPKDRERLVQLFGATHNCKVGRGYKASG
jgi:hypothetical protein